MVGDGVAIDVRYHCDLYPGCLYCIAGEDEAGGIQFILDLIKSRIHGAKGARNLELRCWRYLVDLCTANNTVAIVMTGPIAQRDQ